MAVPIAPRIGADVARLYHTLRTAGADFPRLHLQLDSDAGSMWQLGFDLIRSAMVQLVPDVLLINDRRNRIDCRIDAPTLSVIPSCYECLSPDIRSRYRRYECAPVTLHIYRMSHLHCIQVLLVAGEPDAFWYARGHRLSSLWDDLRATVHEIQRVDTHLCAG